MVTVAANFTRVMLAIEETSDTINTPYLGKDGMAVELGGVMGAGTNVKHSNCHFAF